MVQLVQAVQVCDQGERNRGQRGDVKFVKNPKASEHASTFWALESLIVIHIFRAYLCRRRIIIQAEVVARETKSVTFLLDTLTRTQGLTAKLFLEPRKNLLSDQPISHFYWVAH